MRRGFTLLEIMIAVGVIALLLTIGAIAFNVVGGSAAEKATRVQMEVCKSLMTEYELTGKIPAFGSGDIAYSSGYLAKYAYTGGTSPADTVGNMKINLGPSVLTALTEGTNSVIAQFLKVPKNAALVQQLGTKQTLSITTSTPVKCFLLSDGWQQPIYYVNHGLTGVTITGSSTVVTITAPDNKPFWVSGGPDGDITTGDDNIYSFNVQ